MYWYGCRGLVSDLYETTRTLLADDVIDVIQTVQKANGTGNRTSATRAEELLVAKNGIAFCSFGSAYLFVFLVWSL
jgi:hypothetical protein